MPEVNPNILHWARKTAGLSADTAVRKLQLHDARGVAATDRLTALEEGKEEPSRAMLRRMAAQYRRPLVTFYLEDIPRKGNRGNDFRTLPEQQDPSENGLLDVLLRDLKARQRLLHDALSDDEDIQPLSFIGSASMAMGVRTVKKAIMESIDFSRDDFRAARDADNAFKQLRVNVEASGIFVLQVRNLGSHHTNISVETFRGIALADDIAPFIAINAGDAKAAQSFTLLHELVHLWLGSSGVSGPTTADNAIERFCNDVASEILVPQAEMESMTLPPVFELDETASAINTFAQANNVSRSMVAYKLYRKGRLDFEQWSDLQAHYRRHWMAARERQKQQITGGNGPNANIVARSRLGSGLVATTERLLRAGDLSTTKAGKVLGVKPTRVGDILKLSERQARRT